MSAARAVAECFLMDVGQGSCNVVLLGQGRAIVIDCGPASASSPLQLLKRHVSSIEALIISHNHQDHDGGAARILQAYPKAVKRVYFLEDGPATHIRTFRLAKAERESGNLLCEPERIEAKAEPQLLFPRPGDQNPTDYPDLQLLALYPSMMNALAAQEELTPQRRSNRTSAVLALVCANKRAVYPGDTDLHGWEAIHSRYPVPIKCDVLVLSHHGAPLTEKRRDETEPEFLQRATAEYSRVLRDIICPKVVVASVGSNNQHRHPSPSSIHAARAAGAAVMCTQITNQCADDIEALKPGVALSPAPSRSSIYSRPSLRGHSRDIGCAGTVVLRVSPSGIFVQNLSDHQDAVDKLAQRPGCHPICRARRAG